MSSVFAAIRAALRPAADALSEFDENSEGETEAQPLRTGAEPKEGDMPNDNPAAGADVKPGIPEADHKAAVAKAVTEGKADGFKAANDRMAAILGAEGIKADGKRMAAGLDLALKSPDMAADDVVAFVSGNVAAATATAPAPKGGAYEQQRLAAAQLVQPGGGQPAADTSNKQVLADAVARINKRNNR